MIKTSVEGLEDFKQDIRYFERKRKKYSRRLMSDIEKILKRDIERAPWNIGDFSGGVPVDDGTLKRSHNYTSNSDRLRIEVNSDYGHYVHEGTRYMEARPWLDNSLKKSKQRRKRAEERFLDRLVNNLT